MGNIFDHWKKMPDHQVVNVNSLRPHDGAQAQFMAQALDVRPWAPARPRKPDPKPDPPLAILPDAGRGKRKIRLG